MTLTTSPTTAAEVNCWFHAWKSPSAPWGDSCQPLPQPVSKNTPITLASVGIHYILCITHLSGDCFAGTICMQCPGHLKHVHVIFHPKGPTHDGNACECSITFASLPLSFSFLRPWPVQLLSAALHSTITRFLIMDIIYRMQEMPHQWLG